MRIAQSAAPYLLVAVVWSWILLVAAHLASLPWLAFNLAATGGLGIWYWRRAPAEKTATKSGTSRRYLRFAARGSAGLATVILVTPALFFAFGFHEPGPPKSFQSVADMETYFSGLVASRNPPAVSVAVVKDGAMVYENGFGVANAEGDSASKDTAYQWWSMTKIPTAIALLQLQDEGRLQLDDQVTDYLPFMKFTTPQGEAAELTIRHLATHTSGIANNVPAVLTWFHFDDDAHYENQTALLESRIGNYRELLFEPGEGSYYSNLNYGALASIIEVASGRHYSDYLMSEVIEPLGMKHTDFIYTPVMQADHAVGTQPVVDLLGVGLNYFYPLWDEVVDQRQAGNWHFNHLYADMQGPTGLIGSASDVARLLLAYLDGGPVVSNTTAAFMTSSAPIAPYSPNSPDAALQGFGWQHSEAGDWVGHSGGGPGFAAIMRAYPADQLGIVVMGGGTHLDREGIVDAIAHIVWSERR